MVKSLQLNLIVLLILSLVTSFSTGLLGERFLKVTRLVGKCRQYPKVAATIDQVKIYNGKTGVSLALRVKVSEEIGEQLKIQFLLQRCESMELINTCEKIPPIEIPNFCGFLDADDTYWSPLVKSLEPPLRCPIKKGAYVTKNGTLDASAITALPIEGHYWKLEIRVVDESTNKVILCFNTDGQVVRPS